MYLDSKQRRKNYQNLDAPFYKQLAKLLKTRALIDKTFEFVEKKEAKL